MCTVPNVHPTRVTSEASERFAINYSPEGPRQVRVIVGNSILFPFSFYNYIPPRIHSTNI